MKVREHFIVFMNILFNFLSAKILTWKLLVTLTTVMGVRHSSVAVILSVCPYDNSKKE